MMQTEATSKSKRKMPCEVYTRVVGYMRPVLQWNPGKQSEFNDRKNYDVNNKLKEIFSLQNV